MSIELKVSSLTGNFRQAFNQKYGVVARAVTLAMREIADLGETQGRDNIASAGFGPRWTKSWKGDAYPPAPTVSVRAAAYFRHGIPFAGVYEDATSISGNPLMWILSKNAPKLSLSGGRGNPKLKPRNFRQQIGKLYLVTRNVKRPLLMAPISVPRSQKTGPVPSFGFGELLQGQRPPMRVSRLNRAYKVKRMVPIFVGVRQFETKKKFNLKAIVNRLRRQFPAYYFKHLRDE